MDQLDYQQEPKVKQYRKMLEDAGCRIRGLKPLTLLHKRNGELLFGMFEVDAVDPAGNKLLPYVLVRGHACVIVPVVRNADTGEERFLMVRQRRTGNGQLCLEFPAGMLDREIDDPMGVARREVEEETGLKLDRSQFFPLHDKPLFSSVGLQDEAVLYYGCRAELCDKEYRAFEGRISGSKAEGEHIQVTLMTREQAEKEATSLQVMLGFCLYQRLINSKNRS
jgi:ADP-sugar diphosphatase